jgi:hypothetical protein
MVSRSLPVWTILLPQPIKQLGPLDAGLNRYRPLLFVITNDLTHTRRIEQRRTTCEFLPACSMSASAYGKMSIGTARDTIDFPRCSRHRIQYYNLARRGLGQLRMHVRHTPPACHRHLIPAAQASERRCLNQRIQELATTALVFHNRAFETRA